MRGGEEWLRDACSLLSRLLGSKKYWDKRLVLNSDGRRLLQAAARRVMESAWWLRGWVDRARRDPSWENVAALAERLGCSVPENPPWLELPYRWSPRRVLRGDG